MQHRNFGKQSALTHGHPAEYRVTTNIGVNFDSQRVLMTLHPPASILIWTAAEAVNIARGILLGAKALDPGAVEGFEIGEVPVATVPEPMPGQEDQGKNPAGRNG